jgi:hypothetical protein
MFSKKNFMLFFIVFYKKSYMKKNDNVKEVAKPGNKIDFFISSNVCQPIHNLDDGFDGLRKRIVE